MCGDIFGCHNWEVLLASRNAAKHSLTHRTAPTTKNYLAQNINGPNVGKHGSELSLIWMLIIEHLSSTPVLVWVASGSMNDLKAPGCT